MRSTYVCPTRECQGGFYRPSSPVDASATIPEAPGPSADSNAPFPEIAPLLPWHLNDLKAGCEHQDVLGWGHGIDVTVEPESKEAQNAWGATVTVTTQRKVYKDSIGAPCPTCGYCYGTAWTKRELPPEIVKLAEEVAA